MTAEVTGASCAFWAPVGTKEHLQTKPSALLGTNRTDHRPHAGLLWSEGWGRLATSRVFWEMECSGPSSVQTACGLSEPTSPSGCTGRHLWPEPRPLRGHLDPPWPWLAGRSSLLHCPRGPGGPGLPLCPAAPLAGWAGPSCWVQGPRVGGITQHLSFRVQGMVFLEHDVLAVRPRGSRCQGLLPTAEWCSTVCTVPKPYVPRRRTRACVGRLVLVGTLLAHGVQGPRRQQTLAAAQGASLSGGPRSGSRSQGS